MMSPRASRLVRPRARSGWFVAALALASFCPAPVLAQFNGPAQVAAQSDAQPVTITTDRSVLFPATHDQFLAAGDQVSVHLFGQSDYNPSVRVANDGTAQLPLIGVVPLAGLTVTAAERLIEEKLETARMYRDPQVTVQIAEGPNSVVTVVGEAHGLVSVIGSRRLLDVLSSVGGLPGSASHIITIHRPGVDNPIVVDLGNDPLRSELANIPVFPGDTVVIARGGVVYVLGAFKTPGVIALNAYTPLTLMELAAQTGGPAFEAKLSDLHLIRTEGNHRTEVKLNMSDVLKGKAPDPILQPNDIIYLPTSFIKVAIQQGGIGTLFGAAGLALTVFAYTHP